jgi:glutamate carboxypeptidase
VSAQTEQQLVEKSGAFVQMRRGEILTFLGQLIDLQGGSEDREAVNAVGAALTSRFEALGFQTQRFVPPGRRYGDHLVFRRGEGDEEQGRIVLAGHMDTTFRGYEGLPPFHLDGDLAVGPGTADMRGGLVVVLYALELLQELRVLGDWPVTVICNADEERGSSTSHEIFSAEAARARYAMVFECAGKDNEVVVGRRGKLSAHLAVQGRAGHAAERGVKKASAIEAVAHKVIALEGLNDGRKGASFNVGLIDGGIAGNTFPADASIDFDIRYLERADRGWVEGEVRRIAEDNAEGVTASVEWTSARPNWAEGAEVSEQAVAQGELLEAIERGSALLGVRFGTEFRYGTSDANFLAGGGAATVDGMGPVGFKDHTADEYIVTETLFERVRLTALVLWELLGGR